MSSSLVALIWIVALVPMAALWVVAIVALVSTHNMRKELDALRETVAAMRNERGWDDGAASESGAPAPAASAIGNGAASAHPMRPPAAQPEYALAEPGYAAAQPEYAPAEPARVPGPQPRVPGPQPHAPQGVAVETWIGRNVIGIVASVLVFIGLTFLGFLIVPAMTDAVKMLCLFTLSTMLTVAGLLLTRWRSNRFSVILTGCGIGAFFISIMLTHLFFHALPDVAAFSLLVVWMAVGFYLVRWTQSVLLSIIVHIGMIVSLVMAWAGGLSDQNLSLLLCYQVISTVVVCVGNVFCCKATYRFGLFASAALTLVASGAMWSRFMGTGAAFATQTAPAFIAAVFLLQFAGASFLAYLLFVSTVRLENRTRRMVLYELVECLWLAALTVNVTLLAFKLYFVIAQPPSAYIGDLANYRALLWALGITAVVVCLKVAFSLAMQAKLQVESIAVRLGILLPAAYLGVLCLVVYTQLNGIGAGIVRLPGCLFVAIGLLVVARLTRDQASLAGAVVLAAVDIVLMMSDGFQQTTKAWTVGGSLIYALIALAVIVAAWWLEDEDARRQNATTMRICALAVFQLSLLSIVAGSGSEGWLVCRVPLMFIVLACVLIVLFAIRFDVPAADGLPWPARLRRFGADETVLSAPTSRSLFMRVDEYIVIFGSMAFVAFDSHQGGVFSLLYIVVSALCMALVVLRCLEARSSGIAAVGFATGLAFSGFVLALVLRFYGSAGPAYLYSIVVMLTALVCVSAGFAGRISTLRLYGLIATLVCVVKLVTYDISAVPSFTRVLAFIGGGLICFVISALYNYAVKYFDRRRS